jgi:glycosyltransferase involved in cell wall biosynthesis
MKLGIVIPCFNESENIPELMRECVRISSTYECQFLVIDNGSMDETWSILNSYEENAGVRFLRIERNLGYGHGIHVGLGSLETEYVGWMHGDLQTDMEVISKSIPLLKPTSFLKGKRKKRKLTEKFVSNVMARLVSSILGEQMTDINAQPMIFHRSHMEALKSLPNDYNFDLYVYFSMIKEGLQEERVETAVSARRHGNSAWNFGLSSKYIMSKNVLTYTKSLKEQSANYPTQN